MSTPELRLTGEVEFARTYATFDRVVHHGEQPDRLREQLALVTELVEELARREL